MMTVGMVEIGGNAFPESGRLDRRRVLKVLTGLMSASMAGCMSGPDFSTPAAPVADKWLEWRNKGLKSSQDAPGEWWRLFRDPVLNRLIEIAYAQNLTLLSAGTKVLQARAELGVAVGSFFPQAQGVSSGVAYVRASNATPASQGGNSASLGNFWADRWLVQSSWELDLWGKFRRGIESADAAYLASIASYDDVLVTLLSDVAGAYVGIRTLERQIAIARANVARQREQVRIARDRFQGGASTMLDVHQAQNVLASTEASIPRLEIQLRHGLNALRVLLGMAPEPLGFLLARGTGKIPVAPGAAAVGIPADLLRRRPDIRVAELRAEGRIVFVNATAAWCISCQVNERVALRGEAVQSAFAARGVAYLKADWTGGDPAIAALLRAHGRDGVPLYLVYPAGGGAPEVLPQLLTEGIVLRAIGG